MKAGSGGKGCYTFFADKFVSKGPPDGGCGGAGGDVYLEASRSLIDLHHFRRKDLIGNDGTSGGNNSCYFQPPKEKTVATEESWSFECQSEL